MDEMVVSILLNNLLKNSYVHNIQGGKIQVEITEDRLLMKNTSNLGKLDGKQIFDRFYQGSKKEGSTGLGLALVKSICDANKLNIRYYYLEDFHCFEIYFRKNR